MRFGKYWRNSPLVFSLIRVATAISGRRSRPGHRSDREWACCNHLLALIPCQRFHRCAGRRWTVASRAARTDSAFLPSGKGEQHHVAGPALDERADRGLAFAHDQVAFPMPRPRTVLDRSRPFTDHEGPTIVLCPMAAGRLWAVGSPGGYGDAW